MIIPKNYSLAAVNLFVGATGLGQLARIHQCVSSPFFSVRLPFSSPLRCPSLFRLLASPARLSLLLAALLAMLCPRCLTPSASSSFNRTHEDPVHDYLERKAPTRVGA